MIRLISAGLAAVRWLLAAIGLVALALAGMLAWPIRQPPELTSISSARKSIDFSALPAVERFQARDGTDLAYRHYAAQAPATGRIAVVVHGSSGSSRGAIHALSAALAERGVQTFSVDIRGHGSSGTRGDIRYIGQLEEVMQRLRTGRMEESDWTRLTRSLGKLADAPLFIDDSPGTTMMEIRAKCRRLKQRHGLGLVVVDYLQLMQPSKRFENRQQEVSEISRSLKLLAKELDVPVMAISQLSRQTESRSDRRPMLSDLRESGALEQDSDVVLFIYRDELYDPESARKGEADLILAKHRNGPTDTVTVTFQGQYSRFAPMAARSL